MSNSKISALTSVTTPLAGTEVLPVVQSSATTKVAVSDLTAGRSVSGANFVVTSSTIPANGVYLPATNSVGIATNSTLRATVDASGNVGIGTSPAARLDVKVGATNGTIEFGRTATELQIFVANGNNQYLGNTVAGSVGVRSATGSGLFLGTQSTESLVLETNSSARAFLDSVGNFQFQSGPIMPYAPAPAAISAAATLTNANIQGQIISATGTTYTITMPLGTTLDTLATWANINIGYDFFVINTAAGVVTMAVNTGVTSLGLLTIAAATSAHFRIRRTAASTYVLYRLV